jgi:hypothetical protein
MVKLIRYDVAPVSQGNWYHVKFLAEKAGIIFWGFVWASDELLADKSKHLENVIISEAEKLFELCFSKAQNA